MTKKVFFSYEALLAWLQGAEAARFLRDGYCFEFGVTV